MSAGIVTAAIARGVWRLRALHAVHAAAFGALAGAAGSAVARALGYGTRAALIAGGAAALPVAFAWFRRTASRRSARAAARLIEAHRPEFRNLLITAEELLRDPARTSEWIRARVVADAAAVCQGDAGPPVRVAPAIAAFVVALAAWAGALANVHRPVRRAASEVAAVAQSVVSGAPIVRVTVAPPAYTGRTPESVTNPERVDALEGSRLLVAVSGGGSGVRIRLGSTDLSATRGDGAWIAEATVSSSGYLAIEPETGGGAPRRLIAIAVTPDREPMVTVETPGKDLLLAEARRIPVRAAASDDLALRSLELRYTKVSGSGEQFEFVEGSAPVEIARDSASAWRGTAELPLDALRLEAGDSLVYRVVARDGRPGDAGLGSSDTFFVEIAGPGQAALAGVELPPEQDRYALSQQMIVLKIERLRAREAAMEAGARSEAFENLAAEQRAVRANFIFLMGGHVEDEEVEAEQSHEIQEGRLDHRARRDLSAAVRQMTLAERGLAAFSSGAALPPAKAAVDALQRAFGRSRYILRSMPVRGRIDPARRLSGELRGTGAWQRDAAARADDAPPAQARALMVRVLEATAGTPSDEAAAARLAEDALRVSPASADWQAISRALAARRFDDALARLQKEAAKDALPAPDGAAPPSRLWRVWAEARR
jgi:hypothetical protein